MKIDAVNSFITQMPSYAQQGVDDGPGGTSFGDVLAQAAAQAAPHKVDEGASTEEENGPTLIERIREKGFMAFVDDLQEEKLKELRKKILASMGYTEEDLKAMSPEQRAEVEKIVDNEIIKRMEANAALKNQGQGQGQGQNIMGIVQQTNISVQVTKVSMQATTVQFGALQAGSMGLGPLLAHQEVEAERAAYPQFKDPAQDPAQDQVGKKDRVKLV